jgi:TolA-binding protein
MESDVTQSVFFDRAWAWADTHKKQLLAGGIAIVAAGVIIALWVAHQSAEQNEANFALSKLLTRGLTPNAPETSPDAFLKVAAEFPGTDAAARAQLLGAGELFAAGKYPEAQAQFQKFLQEHSDSSLAAQAALGVAASQDSQGKTNEAIESYRGVAGRYSGNPSVVGQAKLSLARLLEAQGKLQDARTAYEEVARLFGYYSSMGSEAARRFEALTAAHPELVSTNRPTAPPAIPLLNPKN